MAAAGEPWPDLHEKNSAKLEKRCFARKPCKVLLIRLLGVVRKVNLRIWSTAMAIDSIGWLLSPREIKTSATADPQFYSSSRAGEWLYTPLFWIERSRQRRQLGELAELDNYLLKDIGLSKEDALREAAKPFWR